MSPSRLSSAFACVLAVAAPAPITSFAPSNTRTAPAQQHAAAITTPLHMSSVPHATEDMYPQLLSSASLCAHSESCSIDAAESYLREIVHIQSGCAAGTLSGSAACNDVAGVSEVVADLRQKIREEAKREVGTFWDKRQDELETLAAASAAPLAAPIKPAYLALAALYAIALVSVLHPATASDGSAGVVPFSAQEVWWAVRDGYAGDLAGHLFRNGGLAAGDGNVVSAVGSALSPQELFWSVRDGYAGNTMASSLSGGGVESVSFTPQEVWWAVKDGYSVDMVEHWFRNGGLSM